MFFRLNKGTSFDLDLSNLSFVHKSKQVRCFSDGSTESLRVCDTIDIFFSEFYESYVDAPEEKL